MNIIKRSGEEQVFDRDKIIIAITRANVTVSEDKQLSTEQIKNIAKYVERECSKRDKSPTVEDIQDFVEKRIMSVGAYDVAKNYIVYRYTQQLARSQYKKMMDAVKDKLFAEHVQNQNANVDEYSFGGRAGEASSLILRSFALDYMLSPMAKNNHLNNEVYIHDLDWYALGGHNCLSVPFDDILANGFITKAGDVRSPNSVDTALQLVAVIFQLQSLQQFGGVSATHLDWTMVPYVRKSFSKHFKDGLVHIAGYSRADADSECSDRDMPIDSELYTHKHDSVYKYAMEMTEREVQQASEALYHNLNTLQSRSGNQLPFTSINFGTCTLPEGRMVSDKLLDALSDGIGRNHRTSIFPCTIFQCMKGVNRHKGDPNYDLFKKALKVTSKRLYPNYANCDWSGNSGYDKNDPATYFSTMGCRTANGFDVNGLKQRKDGRGNICPTTIILPTLAMESGRDVESFMLLLEKKIGEAKDMLLERFEWICSQSPKSASFMYENNTMAGYVPEEGIRSALKHGTLAIGQLGLAETLRLLIGVDQTTKEGMELAKRIEQLFSAKCAEFKKQYSLNFGVYFTPAENLCFTAMKKFKEKYGEIAGVSDKAYFTNSTHVSVWIDMTPFEKIDIEAELAKYSSAGCITYTELDSSCMNNTEALEDLVNYAMDKDIPYFAINVPNDQCQDCGYIGEVNDACPKCNSTNIKRLRRVTGYLTGDYKTSFNLGKQAETEDRAKHEGLEK